MLIVWTIKLILVMWNQSCIFFNFFKVLEEGCIIIIADRHVSVKLLVFCFFFCVSVFTQLCEFILHCFFSFLDTFWITSFLNLKVSSFIPFHTLSIVLILIRFTSVLTSLSPACINSAYFASHFFKLLFFLP